MIRCFQMCSMFFPLSLSLSLCELCQRPSHSGFLRDQGQHMNLKLHTSLSLLLCSFLVFFLFPFFSPPFIISIYIYVCVYRYSKRFSFDESIMFRWSRGQRCPCHFLCQRSWVTCGKDIDQGRLIYVPAMVKTVDLLFLFMSCALFILWRFRFRCQTTDR